MLWFFKVSYIGYLFLFILESFTFFCSVYDYVCLFKCIFNIACNIVIFTFKFFFRLSNFKLGYYPMIWLGMAH